MDKATQKSIEWQKANNPMAIGGDAFANMVDFFNANPAFVAGYKEAEKDLALTWEDIPKLIELTGKTFRIFSDSGRSDVPLQELYEEVLRRFNEQKKK